MARTMTIEEWQFSVIEALRPRIESLADAIPDDISPVGATRLHEIVSDMRTAACEGDVREVEHLAAMFCDKLAMETRWAREGCPR